MIWPSTWSTCRSTKACPRLSRVTFDAIVENNTVDGKLVGIPFFTDAGLLYYRTDLIEQYSDQLTEAGLPEDPAEYTWANLEQAAQIIQEGEQGAGNANFTGFTWQGNSYEGLTCDALEWVASAGGGTIVSPEGEITVFNEDAIAAVEQAAGWVGTISPSGVTEFQEEDARRIWSAGNAAFMRNWPYAYSLSQAEDSPIAGNVGIAPLPSGESGDRAACLGGWQIAVSEYSEQPRRRCRLWRSTSPLTTSRFSALSKEAICPPSKRFTKTRSC